MYELFELDDVWNGVEQLNIADDGSKTLQGRSCPRRSNWRCVERFGRRALDLFSLDEQNDTNQEAQAVRCSRKNDDFIRYFFCLLLSATTPNYLSVAELQLAS